MPDLLNVFEHQRFRLRTPIGEPVEKTFRQLLTEPDAAYALDYAQAFYDVAALNLMAFLAQAAFEPATVEELAGRFAAPMAEADFEEAVAPLRKRFALTGDGPRFMQAPDETWVSGREPIGRAILSTHAAPNEKQDDKRFLSRLDPDWVVSIEQSALFLFARNTFFPGMLGGHKKGPNGNNPIRVLITDPADGDALWLRRTVWLNVLAREQQREYPGAYADPDALRPGEYNDFFWVNPPRGDIPAGGITLRSALGWMSDYYWLYFEQRSDDGVCPLTGRQEDGPVAREMGRKSTRIAYGDSSDSLFRHPNVPIEKLYDAKARDWTGKRPFRVHRTEGLANAIGAVFFGGRSQEDRTAFVLAPAVDQAQAPPLRRAFARAGRQPAALVFGFHMLSNQKNVHGGIEQDTFTLPLLGSTLSETQRLMASASKLMYQAGAVAEKAAQYLRKAVKRAQGVDAELNLREDGSFQLVDKRKNLRDKTNPSQNPDGVPFGRDTLAAFWRAVQHHLVDHAGAIAHAAADGPDALTDQGDALREQWADTVVRDVRRQFEPVFEHYATLPRTMPYAHAALRLLNADLKKLRPTQPATP